MRAKDERPKTKSKFEHSAGGVIFRKQNDRVQILLLKDKNGQWSFPKGLIERGEESVKTAEREIEEEVGLTDLHYIEAIDTIRYMYRFKGTLVRKKVDFYLFAYEGNEEPRGQREEGISHVDWFTPQKALEIIGYARTNKGILEKAIRLINTSS